MSSIYAQVLKMTPKAYQNSAKILLNHGCTLYGQLPKIARVAIPAVPFGLWMLFPTLTASFRASIGLPSGTAYLVNQSLISY